MWPVAAEIAAGLSPPFFYPPSGEHIVHYLVFGGSDGCSRETPVAVGTVGEQVGSFGFGRSQFEQGVCQVGTFAGVENVGGFHPHRPGSTL